MQPACPVPSSSTALIVADVCWRERAAATFPSSFGIARPLKLKSNASNVVVFFRLFCFVVFLRLLLGMDNRQWVIFGDPLKGL
jgi:hypothetical protein